MSLCPKCNVAIGNKNHIWGLCDGCAEIEEANIKRDELMKSIQDAYHHGKISEEEYLEELNTILASYNT